MVKVMMVDQLLGLSLKLENGKIYYKRKDVEHFIKTCTEKSPMEALKIASIASRAREGKFPFNPPVESDADSYVDQADVN